ncbi:hypothetical protein [Bradyrhizobium zhanjiangense]|uniref:hypothetical protein n=1 Tax=Bradyrhizobium zhanjiangense TaxID=1325107 RepID=UPI001FDEB2F6|nr:hypothetical protein [Bradyrhizobium zhanjiangense]
MAITSGVAATAMAFLAIDAAVDVSPGGIAKRLEVVQASLTDAAVGHHQLAFAVRAWARGSDQTHRPAAIKHASSVTSTGRSREASIAAFDGSSWRCRPRSIMRSILFRMKRAKSL